MSEQIFPIYYGIEEHTYFIRILWKRMDTTEFTLNINFGQINSIPYLVQTFEQISPDYLLIGIKSAGWVANSGTLWHLLWVYTSAHAGQSNKVG